MSYLPKIYQTVEKKNCFTHFTRRKKAKKIKLFWQKQLAFKMLLGLKLAQKIRKLTVNLRREINSEKLLNISYH